MKKVDIRKIYICEIVKQGTVQKVSNEHSGLNYNSNFKWNYEKRGEYGLFTLALGAYRHILTDTIYPRASYKTGNKVVIMPDNIKLFVREERVLAAHLIDKYKSYYMDPSVIQALEERINSDAKYIDEEKQQ